MSCWRCCVSASQRPETALSGYGMTYRTITGLSALTETRLRTTRKS